jgi:DNA-binding CsgD family transcriptional regulator
LASLQPVAPVDHVMIFGFAPDARAECLGDAGAIAIAALSPRERGICIKILLGFTSEAIALDLGLSHKTVLTYRRRACERLGIGSQNELFARVFEMMLATP